MKVLLVNTTDKGGAARACIRLHKALLEYGVESKLLLLYKTDYTIPQSYQFKESYLIKYPNDNIISVIVKYIKLKLYLIKNKYYNFTNTRKLKGRPKDYDSFSFPFSGYDIRSHPFFKEADIINLHWVSGFLNYKNFFKNNFKMIIWTLHDMNPFTGGCHYSGDCLLYHKDCSVCPQLSGTGNPKYSHIIFLIKSKALFHKTVSNLTLTTPSYWLKQISEKSVLFNSFKHFHIPNSCESEIYKVRPKVICRKTLLLPIDKKIILFVAGSLEIKRKGFKFLLDVFQFIDNKDDFLLCTVGCKGITEYLPENTIEFGLIEDEEKLAMMYSAADVFVIPSIEDNLPNTIVESLLCGTPVICFEKGGMPEMIIDGVNGLICKNVNSESLANTINNFFNSSNLFNNNIIRENALAQFDSIIQANAFKVLFESLINNK